VGGSKRPNCASGRVDRRNVIQICTMLDWSCQRKEKKRGREKTTCINTQRKRDQKLQHRPGNVTYNRHENRKSKTDPGMETIAKEVRGKMKMYKKGREWQYSTKGEYFRRIRCYLWHLASIGGDNSCLQDFRYAQ
jgi:hypothetical protein